MRTTIITAFLAALCALTAPAVTSAEAPQLAKVVAVGGDEGASPGTISLIADGEAEADTGASKAAAAAEAKAKADAEAKAKAATAAKAKDAAKDAAKADSKAAAKADAAKADAAKADAAKDAVKAKDANKDEASDAADAQVAVSTDAAETAEAGWRWGRRRRNLRRSRRHRRRGLYRWYIRRFKLHCTRGTAGSACRRRRRVRFRSYLRARRRASRRSWRRYSRSVRRSCRGPWKSACSTGATGSSCRNSRRRWRRSCRRRRWRARRKSCKGPWLRRCPAGTAGKGCRSTRRSWRRACRARRRSRSARRVMSRGGSRSRVARLRLRMLRSKSAYTVGRRNVFAQGIGAGYVLEFRPRTGWFQIFRQNRASLNGRSATPLWEAKSRTAYGMWTSLRGHRLTYLGAGRLLAVQVSTGKFRLYRVVRSTRGKKNPLRLISTGTWAGGRYRRLVRIGRGRVLAFTTRGRYAIWRVRLRKQGSGKRYFVRRASGSSWLFSRRGAKYAWVGRGTLLQWHGKSFRMISVKKRARGAARGTVRLLKTLPVNTAMGRAWPYSSGTPYTRMTSLGGGLLVFYRTTGTDKKAKDGRSLSTLTLYPFRVRQLNNPRFGGPMMSRPWLVNKPWRLGKAWRTKGNAPWRNDPRYCFRYKTFPASGSLHFTQRGEVAKLRNAGKAGSTIIPFGGSLLDLDKATGSYRILTYSQRGGMYVQRSFGIIPQFKATWDAIALGRRSRRLLMYNPTTRRFLLYPLGRSSIGKPVASGVLPIPAGYSLTALGNAVLAWKPATGQWRVYRANPDVTGARAQPLRSKFMAAGQWCDIKTGKDIVALNSRDLLVLDKRSGDYTLFRFNSWGRGRRGNVFERVLARGTWESPFVSSGTRIVSIGRSRLLGFKPTSDGSIYSTWTLGYLASGKGQLGSLRTELKKFVGTVKQLRRYVKLGGKNVDPTLALLQRPTFAGMPSHQFRRLFSKYLTGVDVKFPWKSTLKYFQKAYVAKKRGQPLVAEGSDGADSIYSFPNNGQPFPDAEQPPVEKKSTSSMSSSSSSSSDEPRLDANYPVTPSGPGAEVSHTTNRASWPDGKTMETDDVFDDGTGPNSASSGDLLFDLYDTDTMDPAGEGNVGPQYEASRGDYPDVQWHDHVDLSSLPSDDSMSIGDHHSEGITAEERAVPFATDAGPSHPIGSRRGIFAGEDRDAEDPVGDSAGQSTPTGTYPDDLTDFVGPKDTLKGSIVVGDGEAPLEVATAAQ